MSVRPGGLGAVLLLLAVAGPWPATAQSAAERGAIRALRDSLATVTDTASLGSLRRALTRADPSGRADPVLALRLGMVDLRRSALGADPGFGSARDDFSRAARLRPDWPLAWEGLALAERGRADWERTASRNLGSRIGVRALERSLRASGRALDADPGFGAAATAIADVALALREPAALETARRALARAARRAGGHDPSLLLARGRIERACDRADSALASFERYLASGRNRAVALLELARTGLAAGRPRGEAAYYAGAALDDPVAVAGYRADLAAIAPESVLAEFDGARGEARARFLRRFWEDRDRLELRAPGERLREHFRRLGYARRHFALTITRRFYGRRDAYRSGSTELDDRGVIYVRHGAPTDRLRPFVFGLMPNESWRYRLADGDLVFHFSAGYDGDGGGDLYDYRLVASVLDLRGAADAPRDQLLLSRHSLSPLYARMLNWGPNGSARAAGRERELGGASIAAGTSSDSYERQYPRPLAAHADLIAVGRTGKAALGQLVFAVADSAAGRPTAGAAGFPVRARLVVVDDREHAVATLDTTLTARLTARPAGRAGRQRWLVGRAELVLPLGRWSWRAALETTRTTGVVLPRDTVLVTEGAEPGISLSEVAIGIPGASAVWVTRSGEAVPLTPFDRVAEGSAIGLYYELSGAVPGARYSHQIVVLRYHPDSPRGDRTPVLALAYDAEATGSLVGVRRTVGLGRLRRGDYVVEVRVRGPDARTVSRRREIEIVKRGRAPNR